MLPLLKELISRNPFVDQVEFRDCNIHSVDATAIELLGRFTELRKVTFIRFDLFRLTCKITTLGSCLQI